MSVTETIISNNHFGRQQTLRTCLCGEEQPESPSTASFPISRLPSEIRDRYTDTTYHPFHLCASSKQTSPLSCTSRRHLAAHLLSSPPTSYPPSSTKPVPFLLPPQRSCENSLRAQEENGPAKFRSSTEIYHAAIESTGSIAFLRTSII